MVYLMVQAVMFGIGVVLVFGTPLADSAMILMPWVVATSAVLSIPISWVIAPRLREVLARKGIEVGHHLRPELRIAVLKLLNWSKALTTDRSVQRP
jgi:hypothetical protein